MTTHAAHDCGLPYRDCRCGHKHGDGCVGIVDPDVYDGVLWWICDDDVSRPRFSGASPRAIAGQAAADEYNGANVPSEIRRRADCGEPFQVGEHIKRAGDLMQASARPVCGKCWLEIPPSGECGCYAWSASEPT